MAFLLIQLPEVNHIWRILSEILSLSIFTSKQCSKL